MGKSSNTEKGRDLNNTITLSSKGYADGNINSPTPVNDRQKLRIKEQKLDRNNVQPFASASEMTDIPIPKSSLVKGASVPDSKMYLKPAEDQANNKKVWDGYKLIDGSKSVFLFTPKVKALGRVKVIKRVEQNIELLRLHETRLGKSVLLSGKDYQLRFSFQNEPPVILVGNLERKEGVQEKENPNNLNQLSTYTFQIKESWILDEKEIRKPIDLNQIR